MSKKLYFLMCFVLLLGLSGAAQAWESIDDFNYNLSFEYDACGVQMRCHADGNLVDVLGWNDNEVNWANPEIDCANSLGTPDCLCKDDPATTGMMKLTMGQWDAPTDQNLIAWQTLDPVYDGNTIIQQDYEYRMFFDTFKWQNPSLYAYLFYGYIPDNNSLDPDVNVITSLEISASTVYQTFELSFIAEAGQPYIGEPLGVRFFEQGQGWYWIDTVRVEYRPLTKAREPEPANGAVDLPTSGITLRWVPGMYVAADVNSHEVYFGADKAAVEDANRFDLTGIFRGDANGGPDANDKYYYNLADTLPLGQRCYWRIDEVNEAYAGPNPPPGGRWKGDIWSFRVTGSAVNPSPEDEAEDVSLYTDLSWTPGTGSDEHDVYFGTDEDAVTDANIDVNFGVYMVRQDANDFDDFVPALELGKTYYWRIDEVNVAISSLIEGDIWSFTVEDYVSVDDMDSYSDDAAVKAVWNDYWTNATRAETFRETGADFTEDGNSMRYKYTNSSSPYYAEAYADMADLGMGSDWTAGDIEVLTLSFKGKQANALEPMYVALTDGSGRTGKVLYPDSNELTQGWKGFQEWNIELWRFVDDNSVDLTDISRITIGFGDKTAGGSGEVYFDNIRLYPPRCVPEYAHLTGSFRYLNHYEVEGSFVSDCKNDYFDLWSMGSDWLVSSYGNATATTPSDTNLMGHWAMDDDDPQLQVDDSSVNANHGTLYDEDRSPGRSTSKHHTDDCAEGTGALTFDGDDDYIEIPVLDLNSNTVTISVWIKRDGDLGAEGSYPRIVSCNEPNGAAFTFGSTSEYAPMEWSPNNELCYYWTGWSWDAHSGLIVPNQVWSFVALVVEPDKGTLYLYDGLSMKSSVNHEYHKVYAFNDVSFFGGAGFKGAMDDVYIYNRALSPEEILGLAGLSGTHYLALEPWRADANNDDKVDLKDYVIMAKNWLKEILWP